MAWVFRRSGDQAHLPVRARATGVMDVTRRDGVLHRLPAAVPTIECRSTTAARLARAVSRCSSAAISSSRTVQRQRHRPRPAHVDVRGVQTNTGELFAVRPSGRTREIDLGGADVASGDGVLVIDHVAYVGRTSSTRSRRCDCPTICPAVESSRTGDPTSTPTSIDTYRGALYLVNARFTTTPEPDTPYWIAPIPTP